MPELRTIYNTFYEKWNAAGAITGDPLGFVKESATMIDALAVHVARAETELYDLVDRTPDLMLA
jgi:hypothetical protein